MSKKEKTRRHFNRFITFYDNITGNWFYKNQLYLINRMNLKSNSVILDIGCGSGKAVSELALTVPKGKVFGLDFSDKMVERTVVRIEKLPNAFVKYGDAEELPFQAEYFNECISTLSFHHFTNPERVLRETFRVLKRGGKLYILDHFQDTLFGQLMEWVICKRLSPGHVKAYTPLEITTMLKKNSFTNITFEHYRWHLGLVIAKKDDNL